jgi:catalase-peroxidase
VPEPQLWQDPVPAPTGQVTDSEIAELKQTLLGSGLTIQQLVETAWASAASFRTTDKRGGANGARIRLEPQRSWAVNKPAELATVLAKLEEIKAGSSISLADLIVLGGCAAVEEAARQAGVEITVPFAPGRGDATQEQTDVDSFDVLEPRADGFRNYLEPGSKLTPETLLIDRAYMLDLTAKEMTVLVGGLRAIGIGGHGLLTDRPGALTNDFFVNLLATREWKTSASQEGVYEFEGRTATAVDLVFGSNSVLRGIAEVYAFEGSQQKLVQDFVAAWDKVMNLDRFDLG